MAPPREPREAKEDPRDGPLRGPGYESFDIRSTSCEHDPNPCFLTIFGSPRPGPGLCPRSPSKWSKKTTPFHGQTFMDLATHGTPILGRSGPCLGSRGEQRNCLLWFEPSGGLEASTFGGALEYSTFRGCFLDMRRNSIWAILGFSLHSGKGVENLKTAFL